mmetsp:Transcript_26458/g.83860  ORF Transcript_26458/g.83860 Transcript_26458/m.83860 type:complete len:710 (-) Transcript_26458:29-2158(-)
MLQDCPGLVGTDAFRHHVDDVVHDGCAQLQVEVALHPLLGDGLRDALGDTALKLAGQQIAQPTLQQRHDPTEEEEPHTPAWRPEATPRPLAHWTGVEAVVDQVLQVLAHAHLPHQPVLVPVHAGQLPHVGKDVLQAIGELEGIDVTQTELHVTVDDQLCQTHDLAAQVEGVAEPRLLALLGRQRLHRLQVEVVVEVQEVQVLARNQEVQHVVALTTHLQPNLDPVQLRPLEELRGREDVHQVALVQRLRRPVVQLVQHPDLQQLLVRHAHLDRVIGGAVLLVPLSGERHVLCTPHVATAQVEGPGCPVQRDAVRGAVCEERRVVKEWPDLTWQPEALDLRHVQEILRPVRHGSVGRQGIHNGIVVESRQIRVISLDVADSLVVVRRHGNLPRPGVVEEGESNPVLSPKLLSDDDLVDVIELVPVLVLIVHVAVQRLELGATWDCHVQGLRSVKGLLLEEVEVIPVHQVGEQLVREPVQDTLLSQGQAPLAVACAVDLLGVQQRHGVIEPIDDRLILDVVQAHLNGLKRLDIKHVVSIIQRRLLVIERREAHSLEVAPVTLLTPHHDPHGPPLGQVHRLNDFLDLRAEGDGTAAVVHRPAVPNLLPRHGDVLQQLVHCMREVLQRTEVDAFVMAELARRHISVVLDDLPDVLRRHLFLLLLYHPKLPLLAVALGVQGLPLSRLLVEQLFLRLLRLLWLVRLRDVRAMRSS